MTDLERVRSLCQTFVEEAEHQVSEVGIAGASQQIIREGVARQFLALLDGLPPLNSPERIPSLQREALDSYAQHGLQPGQFLRAVLEDRLFDAMSRADDACLLALPAIVTYVRCSMPAGSWGSPEAVSRWMGKVRA